MRSLLSASGFVLLLALEQAFPFKPAVDRRLPRYARNVLLSLFNAALLQLLLGGAAAAYTGWLAARRIGFLNVVRLPGPAAFLVTLASLDLATYAFHWYYHTSPALWRLHRVHHCDLDLDVTSASRFHPGEILLSTVYRFGVLTFLGASFSGAVAFEACLLGFAQFEHSNIALPGDWDRRLRWVFVTPDMHRVHHCQDRDHTNSNFSTVFSFWDRLFGTYIVEGVDQVKIRVGIPEYTDTREVTLGKLLVMPFGPECKVAGRSPAYGTTTYSVP